MIKLPLPSTGVRERFGDDIFEVVERDGGKLMHFKAEGGKKIDVVFDKKVGPHSGLLSVSPDAHDQ